MNKHTPGTWTVETHCGHPHIEIRAGTQRLAYMQDHLSQSKPNAFLIAAAPDLLSALRSITDMIQAMYHVEGKYITSAKAAIAKAEGREGE